MNRKFFSVPLFIENLKRYWSMSALDFVVLFMSLPFYLLLHYENEQYSYYTIANGLVNQNVGFMLSNLILPIAVAVALFSFLYKTNSVNTMHALPFSKSMIYVTDYISGLVLMLIPYILNMGLLILLMKPTFHPYTDLGANIYTVSACLGWLLNSFSMLIFIFSIAVLACMISGNGVIATLTAGALNFLLPGIIVVCYGYMKQYYYGFSGSDIFDTLIAKLSPYLMVFRMDDFTVLAQLVYIVIAVAIAILGWYAYYCRKLERCGDSYVFKWVETVIGFLFVFLISSACELGLFEDLGVLSYVIGGILGFIIGQMISRKTFRLFNKKTLRNFVLFAVLMTIIIASFTIDLFGYERRLPDEKNVASAEIEGYLFQMNTINSGVKANSPDEIETVVELHEEIVGNRDTDYHEKYGDAYNSTYLYITYTLNDGSQMRREYNVPYSFLSESKPFNDILKFDSSTEKIVALKQLDPQKAEIKLVSELAKDSSYICPDLSSTQKKALLEAISNDTTDALLDFEQNEKYISLFEIEIEYTDEFEDAAAAEDFFSGICGYNYYNNNGFNKGENYFSGYYSFTIPVSYSNTLEWVEKFGFDSVLNLSLSENEFIIITSDYEDFDRLVEMRISNKTFEDCNKTDGMVMVEDAQYKKDIIMKAAVNPYYGINQKHYFWAGIIRQEDGYYWVSYTFYVDYDKLPSPIQAQLDRQIKD